MNDAASERLYALNRRVEVADRKVGQRRRVPGPAAAGVDPDWRSRSTRLPALPFSVGTNLEGLAEQPRPEAPRSRRIVGGELD